MKKVIILAAIGILLLTSFGFLAGSGGTKQEAVKSLKIGGVVLNIEVASTDAERQQGLSGRDGLGGNEGMLFIFEKRGYYGFWMKDMKFAIDMAWLDKNKKIIFIRNNVSPDTYPKSFGPSEPSLYVLETNAGFFESNKIKIGDIAEF
jgi:uncharacterized protein